MAATRTNQKISGGRNARQPVAGAEPCSHPRRCFAIAAFAATPAAAQKKGGTLRLYHNDNPPSTSLLEESTIASVTPFAAVFNNLVVFDPAKAHESLDTVIPDLAESWSWDSDQHQTDLQAAAGREMA